MMNSIAEENGEDDGVDGEQVDQQVAPLENPTREYGPEGRPVFRDENLNNLL